MSIVGGLDIHRRQVTFDVVDTVTGQAWRGQLSPADREHLRGWLAGFAGRGQVHLGVEGCTGWRYVAEEVAAAGFTAHVGDPAEIAAKRGRKRRAKTDRADARLQRDLLIRGDFPDCYLPPSPVLDWRQRLESYHDLREQHTAWVQRIHAVLFHQGAPACADLRTAAGRARLDQLCGQLTPAGQDQVATALAQLDLAEEQMRRARRALTAIASHVTGARILATDLYGVGPVTALAMTAWLGGAGRFSSARKAVRFAGLDITVHDSDRHRPPGKLSRQGPPVLRWCAYEAGMVQARRTAPGHDYYAAVAGRLDGKRAALSQARRLIRYATHILADLGDQAFAPC
ncbi:MAG TPA: IS110 family transposase [Streptosporangiaceae bacterium]|jgi:transposase|nr:IS110 family transposase [Streptosporangiaceae bacterium]